MKAKKQNNLLDHSIHSMGALLPGIILGLCLLFPAQKAEAKQSLEFVVENESFFKNIEHTGIDHINDGHTFFGDFLKSYFRYKPNERVTIEVGALLGMHFGNDDRIRPEEPIVSIHLDFTPWFRFTAGTLYRLHPLLDAIYDDDFLYIDPIEQGIQILVNTKHLKQDTWIAWHEIETTTRREKFTVGHHSRFNFWGLILEGQLYWLHYGGQKNSGGGIHNNFSMAAGAGFSVYPKNWSRKLRHFEEAGFMFHYVYNYLRPSGIAPDMDGEGLLGKAFLNFRTLELYYQQWESDDRQFVAERGDPLYKAKQYKEFGIKKTFPVGETVELTLSEKAQWVEGKLVRTDYVTVTWRGAFRVLEDYFNKLPDLSGKKKSAKAVKKKHRKKKIRHRRR